MITTPRQATQKLLDDPRLPKGDDERFIGYGVMGMPFGTGDYLALRDMVATSVGPAYRAIWHRDPAGRWTIYTTAAPELSCPRYFGSVTSSVRVPSIGVTWHDDYTLQVDLGDIVNWRIELGSTPATRMMTTMGGLLPEAGWNSNVVLAAMGPVASGVLQSGTVRLRGATPNGPRFKSAPSKVWRVTGGSATYGGKDLGASVPLSDQTRLGDFWLPQRGIFFVGRARFTPLDAAIARTGSPASVTMGA